MKKDTIETALICRSIHFKDEHTLFECEDPKGMHTPVTFAFDEQEGAKLLEMLGTGPGFKFSGNFYGSPDQRTYFVARAGFVVDDSH